MNKRLSFILSAATFAGALSFGTSVFADECKKVDFWVTNNKGKTIKAVKMEYKFANDNTVRTEQFSNTDVPNGKTIKVASDQNLAGGEGNKMIYVKLHYKTSCGTAGWTKVIAGPKDSTFDDNSVCVSNSGRGYRYDTNTVDDCK